MSYESKFENEYKNYKVDFIELLDEVEEGRLPALPEMRAELDEVYTQATKADEYEAKAKAFDEIFKLYIGYEDGWISFPRGSKSFNKEIINVCKSYESGERNAKK